MKKINVLVIAPYRFLPAINGGHKAIERLYHYLGALTKVTIVSVRSNDEAFAENFQLVSLVSDGPLHYINPFILFRLRKLIRKEGITHVITEHPYMGWLLFLLKKTSGVSWILRSHNIESLRFKTLGKWWWKAMWHYEKWVCSQADLTFFITGEDRRWAGENYFLPEEKGAVITYGADNDKTSPADEKDKAGIFIRNQYGIPSSNRLLLFNGDLGYEPNAQAVQIIVEQIYPVLQQSGFSFTILICGRNLDESIQQKINDSGGKIIYAGFVNDIRQVFLAADVFINPVVSGGGIKTKLVEALSYGCSAVSTVSGATGIPVDSAAGKLMVVPDNEWNLFAEAVIATRMEAVASDDFYSYFYWGNIARTALQKLENLRAE